MNGDNMLVRCCQLCVFSKMTSCKQIHSSTVGRHKPSLIQQQDINVINDVLNIANQMKIDLNLTHPEFRTLVNFIIFLNSTPCSHAFYEKFLNRQLRYPGSYKRSLLLEQAIIQKDTPQIYLLARSIRTRTAVEEDVKIYFQNARQFYLSMRGRANNLQTVDKLLLGYGGEHIDLYLPRIQKHVLREVIGYKIKHVIDKVKKAEIAKLEELDVELSNFLPNLPMDLNLRGIVTDLDLEEVFDQ